MDTCVSAVQHLRRMRGGSQSHLLRASDGAHYVTKFMNNPQHVRVLANEMLATNLGLRLGLPMPRERKADFIEPMDCAPIPKLIDGPGWVYEILCGRPHKISVAFAV